MFGILIFVHELGHFLIAKLTKTGVEEFAIGMGPRILSFKGKRTVYSLRALPVGGFVNLTSSQENPDAVDAFELKSPAAKIAVMAAGALFNILLAVILSIILTGSENYIVENRISEFHENSISQSCGLKEGDVILKIDGKRVNTSSDIVYILCYGGGEPVDVTVERGGNVLTLENVSFEPFEAEGVKGFTADFYLTAAPKTFFGVIKEGFFECFAIARSVWTVLARLVTGRLSAQALSGPVGTTAALSQAVSYGLRSFTYIIILLSVNLGIVNLLPLPVLDGGRIVIVLIEWIGKIKISQKVESAINTVGAMLLIMLMLFVTFNDILRLR